MTFGERLKELRKEKRMTLDEVAQSVGLTRTTIFRYEKGTIKNIPPDMIHRMAELFGVTQPYIMGWTDERYINPAKNFDVVAENRRQPIMEALKVRDEKYWKAHEGDAPDCTVAATQAARALIKYNISRTPIYPQQIMQASPYASLITFSDPNDLEKIVGMNLITSVKRNELVISSIYSDQEGKETLYLFSVNSNAPIGDLKLTLAVELGHIYLGHNSHINESNAHIKEAECFAMHLEFPRAVIKLLQERGYVFTKESFARVFGNCDLCMDSLLNANPVHVSSELNRLVKEQFKPYVDTLIDIGIMLIEPSGEEMDLTNYMAGYED